MRNFSFGQLLTSYRNRLGWTQPEVVDPADPLALKVSLRTYQKWENGESIPSNQWLSYIANLFRLNDAESDELFRAASAVAPKIQNLPFPRNPFFTGRETYLELLDHHFKENEGVAITQPMSLSGLGGIGKTQLALEYAHRCYPNMYRCVLWVNAVDKASLEASYLSLTELLRLPEKQEKETGRIVQAVKSWLEGHTNWLLVLDNADDLELVRSFLPTTFRGHILLTTRSQIVGNIAIKIEIEPMDSEEGLLFLLRRSRVLKDGTKPDTIASGICSVARQLVVLLGGHPLALDQAGAYIEETGISFASYIQLYADQRLMLLKERGLLGEEHPETVVVTFEISFRRAYALYPATADVLHFCSFLHPDDIPEELLSQAKGLKLSVIVFNNAIKALWRYSLIKRNAQSGLLSVHRLVQAVIQDQMTRNERRIWAKRVIIAVSSIYSGEEEPASWKHCERCILQARACASLIKTFNMKSQDAIRLLHDVGMYEYRRGRAKEAEYLLKQAFDLIEDKYGATDLRTVSLLNDLVIIYIRLRKYSEAEPLMQRCIEVNWQENPINIPGNLHNLAEIYLGQKKYDEAEFYLLEGIDILEEVWEYLPKDRRFADLALCLTLLSAIHIEQKEEKKAEEELKVVLQIYEREAKGKRPTDYIYALHILSELFIDQERYTEAELLQKQIISIYEQLLGPNHFHVANALNKLAETYMFQNKQVEAIALLKRAEKIYGPYAEYLANKVYERLKKEAVPSEHTNVKE